MESRKRNPINALPRNSYKFSQMTTKTEQRIHVGFKIDRPVYEELKALADEEHQTVSGLLRKLIAAVMESINAK
jgi:hypothetical protein